MCRTACNISLIETNTHHFTDRGSHLHRLAPRHVSARIGPCENFYIFFSYINEWVPFDSLRYAWYVVDHMISPHLVASLKYISDLSSGYVFHPVVIQIAIEGALRISTSPVNVTEGVKQLDACAVKDCGREPHANSLCHAHYKRLLRGTLSDLPVSDRVKRPKRKVLVKQSLISVMGGRCMMCNGKFHPDVYDFHHVFEKDEDNFSQIFTKSSAEKIAEEISKCALLCANCHRLEHVYLRSDCSHGNT